MPPEVVAIWVSGLGSIIAAVVAVGLAAWGNKKAREAAAAERHSDRAQRSRQLLLGYVVDFAEATGAVAYQATMLIGYVDIGTKTTVWVRSDLGGDGPFLLVTGIEQALAMAERRRRAMLALDIGRHIEGRIAVNRSIDPMPRLHENRLWLSFSSRQGVSDRDATKEFLEGMAADMRDRKNWALEVLEVLDHVGDVEGPERR